MESLVVKHLISNYTTYGMVIPIRNPPISTGIAKIRAHQNRDTSFVLHSKRSSFQDFQDYAKPARLLPAYKVKPTTDSSLEKLITSFKEDKLECLYKLTIQTSNYYGSGLTDSNSGILLCLVDKNGNSILQRIAATSNTDRSLQLEDEDSSDLIHFQRNSVDNFTFEGSVIGNLEALWIGLESGQWRPAGITVICWSRSPLKENENHNYNIFQYDFTADNILLGDKNDISMIELRPNKITKLPLDNSTLIHTIPHSSFSNNLSNKETMKEYENLKFSLLLYDALLIITGSTIMSFSFGENTAFAFLTGGICGFIYLLLLQKSVDELESPVFDRTTTGGFDRIVGRFMGQVTILVLGVTFAVIVVKVGLGDGKLVLTSKDVVGGILGFLVSKVAVVLAAFKPLSVGAKEG